MTARDQAAKAPPKPPWCGECDQDTRLVDLGDEVARCIRCHPRSMARAS